MNLTSVIFTTAQSPPSLREGCWVLLMVAMVGFFNCFGSYVKLTQTKIVNEQEKESFLVERYTLSDSQRLELFVLKMCDGEFSGPNLDFLCAFKHCPYGVWPPRKRSVEVYLVFERRWEKGRVEVPKWERYGYTVFRITDDELSQVFTQPPPPLDLKLAEDIFKHPEVVTDNTDGCSAELVTERQPSKGLRRRGI